MLFYLGTGEWKIIVYKEQGGIMMFNFGRNSGPTINVTPEEARKLIYDNRDILILDVRTPEEFRNGHIPKAINIPLAVLPVRIQELANFLNKPVLVHCQSGGRSISAVQVLERYGFKQLYHMNRGFGAWTYEKVR